MAAQPNYLNSNLQPGGGLMPQTNADLPRFGSGRFDFELSGIKPGVQGKAQGMNINNSFDFSMLK